MASQEPAFQSSQDSFNAIWDNLGDLVGAGSGMGSGEFTSILTREVESQYAYSNEEESTTFSMQTVQFRPQDTITDLFNQINEGQMSPENQVIDSTSDTVGLGLSTGTHTQQQIITNPPHCTSPAPSSAIPSNTDWEGDYGFCISCAKQTKETKSANWTHSESLKKLYVGLSKSCPLRYKCSSPPPAGSYVRAMLIFMKPEHVQEVVKRCPNHMSEFDLSDVPNHHVVRCENKLSQYYDDSTTGRHSVLTPYEPPQPGSDWVTNLYQFMCFSSCVGGLNRRQVQMIFTLESGQGQVLGRQVLEVRVCSCPGRDRKADEKLAAASTQKPLPAKGAKMKHGMEITTVGPANKKRKIEDEEVFTLVVRGRENFEILCKLRDSLEMKDLLTSNQQEAYKKKQQELQKQPIQRISTQSGSSFSQQLTQGDLKPPSLPFQFTPPSMSKGDTLPLMKSSISPKASTSGVNMVDGNLKQEVEQDYSVASWLTKLGFAAYIDNFNQLNLKSMFQLDDYTLQDFEKLSIGITHRNKIWKALVEWRKTRGTTSSQSTQPLDRTGSTTSTLSLASQHSSGYNPGYFEVTRYTFKQTISLSQDHDYCRSRKDK